MLNDLEQINCCFQNDPDSQIYSAKSERYDSATTRTLKAGDEKEWIKLLGC